MARDQVTIHQCHLPEPIQEVGAQPQQCYASLTPSLIYSPEDALDNETSRRVSRDAFPCLALTKGYLIATDFLNL